MLCTERRSQLNNGGQHRLGCEYQGAELRAAKLTTPYIGIKTQNVKWIKLARHGFLRCRITKRQGFSKLHGAGVTKNCSHIRLAGQV